MNQVYKFGANMYFFNARLMRISGVLVALNGFAFGALASFSGNEYAGLNANQLFMVGALGPFVMLAVSVIFDVVGNFLIQGGRETQE